MANLVTTSGLGFFFSTLPQPAASHSFPFVIHHRGNLAGIAHELTERGRVIVCPCRRYLHFASEI